MRPHSLPACTSGGTGNLRTGKTISRQRRRPLPQCFWARFAALNVLLPPRICGMPCSNAMQYSTPMRLRGARKQTEKKSSCTRSRMVCINCGNHSEILRPNCTPSEGLPGVRNPFRKPPRGRRGIDLRLYFETGATAFARTHVWPKRRSHGLPGRRNPNRKSMRM